MVPLDLRQVCIGHAGDPEPRAQRLQRDPHLVCLDELLDRQPPDAGAAEREDLHDAHRLEAPEGLPDRGLARAHLARDARLDDPRIGGIAPAEDLREQQLLDLLREDVPRDRAVVCHRSLGDRRAPQESSERR